MTAGTDQLKAAFRPFRTAGVPASGENEPDKTEILLGLDALGLDISAVVNGLQRFATTALRDADVTGPAGELAYVYANNGSTSDPANGAYQRATLNGAWVAAPWYFDAVAAVVQPLVDDAEDARDEAVAAVGPIASGASAQAEAVTLSHSIITGKARLDNFYGTTNHEGIALYASGAALPGGVNSVLTWLSAEAGTRWMDVALLEFPSASTDPIGDATVLFAERRSLPIPDDGEVYRTRITFLEAMRPDATKKYYLKIVFRDTALAVSGIGFSQATGVAGTNNTANGMFAATGTWQFFASGSSAGGFWEVGETANAATSLGLSAPLGTRLVPIGAPYGIMGQTTSVGGLIRFWQPDAFPQRGVIKKLFFNCETPFSQTFAVSRREADGSMTDLHLIDVYAESAGWNVFTAGVDFDPVEVQAGDYLGLWQRESLDLMRYTVGEAGYLYLSAGKATYGEGATIAYGGAIECADAYERPSRRTEIWSETLDSATPPIGWATDVNIEYGAGGMRVINVAGAGYGLQVNTHKWTNARKRLTRVEFTPKAANVRVGIAYDGASGDIASADYGNSLAEVNGATGQLIIKNGFGAAVDPGNAAVASLGFTLTSDHRCFIEWGIDNYVHSLRLVDMATGAASPVVTSGSNAVAVASDANEGIQNSTLSFVWISGPWTLHSVSVLYDDTQPDVVVFGDSIAQPVLVTVAQSWRGLLDTALGGRRVMTSAQGGATSAGILRCAQNEAVPSRAKWLLAPVGTNDMLQAVAPQNFAFRLHRFADLAEKMGAKAVFARLPPWTAGAGAAAYNTEIDAIAAARPETVILWRWDIALTTNGDGATLNAAMFGVDLIHPSVAGHAALFLRLQLDVPGVMD